MLTVVLDARFFFAADLPLEFQVNAFLVLDHIEQLLLDRLDLVHVKLIDQEDVLGRIAYLLGLPEQFVYATLNHTARLTLDVDVEKQVLGAAFFALIRGFFFLLGRDAWTFVAENALESTLTIEADFVREQREEMHDDVEEVCDDLKEKELVLTTHAIITALERVKQIA